ncbi:hypothetical protein IAR55_002863 [Kwoniella newhampshirensis]|uniref:Uncharacterized protein n=1 Tax=Kwoniella newhampshirensis TaxID=1651941 RepID=A0AAW0Z006_9TREE
MSFSNDQVDITCYEIIREENGKPVLGRNPYETRIRINEKFQVLFEAWHKRHEQNCPLSDFEFLYFPQGMGHGDTCMRLQSNQTPEEVHMRERAKIYAKRKDLNCNCDVEPSITTSAVA